MTENSFTFLGTGASNGVPLIGCKCVTCASSNERNKRLRCSGLLNLNGRQFLIDAGPDVRSQILSSMITRLDGLILTHAHYDHTAGLDDLRPLNFVQQEAIPCLLSQPTLDELKLRFYYFFEHRRSDQTLTAQFDFEVLEDYSGNVSFQDLKIRYFTYFQGGMPVLGLRIGTLAYVTDIHSYNKALFEELRGIEILIVSALRYTPSFLHFTVEQAVEFGHIVGAKQTYFTHLSHELEHEQLQSELPSGFFVGYDGCKLAFDPNKWI